MEPLQYPGDEDTMKRTKILGLVLIAAVTIFAMTAGSATALQWLLNGKPLTTKVAVASSGTLAFDDLAATGGAVDLECDNTDKGTVGPTPHDEITEIKTTGCEFESGKNGACEAEGEVTTTALNLPWLSLLLSVSGVTVDRLTSANGKGIGWAVRCEVAGVLKVTDECTSGVASAPAVFDVEGGVELFPQEPETLSCSDGTKTSGMVTSADVIESPTGETLSVQCAELCQERSWVTPRNVGGAAREERGAICFFTAVGQVCEIQWTNRTGEELDILGGDLMGTNRNLYTKRFAGCRVNARLAAAAGTCTDDIESVRYVAGRLADYCLFVENPARLRRRDCAALKT
jgi:hypothetical protein